MFERSPLLQSTPQLPLFLYIVRALDPRFFIVTCVVTLFSAVELFYIAQTVPFHLICFRKRMFLPSSDCAVSLFFL